MTSPLIFVCQFRGGVVRHLDCGCGGKLRPVFECLLFKECCLKPEASAPGIQSCRKCPSFVASDRRIWSS